MIDPSIPLPETVPVLDVHDSHEPIHGWRDFLLHIATITIGLLIALGLEAAVEWVHHKHIVRESRENIRFEIEANHQQIQKDLQFVSEDLARMKTNIGTIHQQQTDPKSKGSMAFSMSWTSLNDSAWRSSRDMGALTYMPYTEVQDYADLYNQQTLVNQQAVNIFTRQALTAAPMFMYPGADFSRFTPDDFHTLLRDSATTVIGLQTLEQLLTALDQQYTDALRKL